MEFKNTRNYCLALTEELQPNDLVGIKALNLATLLANHLNVPSGFVVSGEAFDDFLLQNDLVEFIVGQLNKVSGPDDRQISEVAHKIREKIFLSAIPQTLRVELQRSYEDLSALGDAYVVVRQSAITQELDEVNFQRNLSGYLNVRGAEMLLDKVVDVWADLFAEEAIRYRALIGYEGNLSQPVLVQRMIAAEVSGQFYNFDLADNTNLNRATIIANLGLMSQPETNTESKTITETENLESDYFLVTKIKPEVVAKINNSQKFMWVRSAQNPDKPFTQVKISKLWSEREKLTQAQILSLITNLSLIETISKNRLEIEWLLESGMIYIVEVREIPEEGLTKLPKINWPRPPGASSFELNSKIQLQSQSSAAASTEPALPIIPDLPTFSAEANSPKQPSVLELLQKKDVDIERPEEERVAKAESLTSMIPEVRTVTEVYLQANRPASEMKVLFHNLDGMAGLGISEVLNIVATPAEKPNLERSQALQKKICEYFSLYLVAISPKPLIIQLESQLSLEIQLQILSQLRSLYGHKNFWLALPELQEMTQMQEIKKELAASGFRRSGSLKIFQLVRQPILLGALDQIVESSLDGIILDIDANFQAMFNSSAQTEQAKLYSESNLEVWQTMLMGLLTTKGKLKTFTIWQVQSEEMFKKLLIPMLEIGLNGIVYPWSDLLDFKQNLVDEENKILTQGLKRIKEKLQKKA